MDRKITAEELREKIRHNDELKSLGDEEFIGELEKFAMKVSEKDIDIQQLIDGINEIIDEG